MLQNIIFFILGAVLGGTAVIIVMACLRVSKTDDDYSNYHQSRDKTKKDKSDQNNGSN